MNLYETTLHIARSIKDASLKASALGDVVAALEKSGDMAHSDAVFQEILEEAHTIADSKDADSAFGLIAFGLIRARNIDKARQIIDLIKDPQNKDSTLWDIVKTFADAGEYERALGFAGEIRGEGPYHALAFEHIALALADASAFDKALEAAHAIRDERRKTMTFMKIATILAEAGDAKQSLALANALPDTKEKAFLLIDIAAGLAEAGDVHNALAVAETVQDDRLRSYAFLDISKNVLTSDANDVLQAELAEKIMLAFKGSP